MLVTEKVTVENPNDHGTNFPKVLAAIEAATGLKLHADEPGDTVHGSVSMDGGDVFVVIYDRDEMPNEEHRSTLKKPAAMPDQEAIKNAIKGVQ